MFGVNNITCMQGGGWGRHAREGGYNRHESRGTHLLTGECN